MHFIKVQHHNKMFHSFQINSRTTTITNLRFISFTFTACDWFLQHYHLPHEKNVEELRIKKKRKRKGHIPYHTVYCTLHYNNTIENMKKNDDSKRQLNTVILSYLYQTNKNRCQLFTLNLCVMSENIINKKAVKDTVSSSSFPILNEIAQH